jgi:hypothetical protein
MENNNEENIKNNVLECARESDDSRHARQIEVINTVKDKKSDLLENCYVVGSWIWAEFQRKLNQEELSFLKELGFRWNPTRKVWQNACGDKKKFSSTADPRKKYSIVALA